MILPCKDCLVLAICKQRITVYCDWLNEITVGIPDYPDQVEDWWGIVHEYLPNAQHIRSSRGMRGAGQ